MTHEVNRFLVFQPLFDRQLKLIEKFKIIFTWVPIYMQTKPHGVLAHTGHTFIFLQIHFYDFFDFFLNAARDLKKVYHIFFSEYVIAIAVTSQFGKR